MELCDHAMVSFFLLLRVVSLGKDLFIWQHILSFSVLVNPSQNIEYDAIEYEKDNDKQQVPKSTVDYPTCGKYLNLTLEYILTQ